MDKEFLLISGAAKVVGVTNETMRGFVKTGKLPDVRTENGYRLFMRSDAERLRDERVARATKRSTRG